MDIPKVFLSYSHDTLEHKKWMLELATRLRNSGVDAIIDQFELQLGDDVPHFMEKHLATSNKILMICTERYVEKANNGQGGVGYEKMIITSNLLKRIDENKIIPIIRQVNTTEVPTFLKSKLYIDFSRDDDYENSMDDLLRTIHNTPLFKKPPVGNNPFQPIEKEKLNDDIEFLNKIISTIAANQGTGSNANVQIIQEVLNISPQLLKIGLIKLDQLRYTKKWGANANYIVLTDRGFIYAYDNSLIK
jgi:hypothetical protein